MDETNIATEHSLHFKYILREFTGSKTDESRGYIDEGEFYDTSLNYKE